MLKLRRKHKTQLSLNVIDNFIQAKLFRFKGEDS